MSKADGRRLVRRRLWFTIHGWVGLKCYLLLSVILLAGTVAVMAAEIDWLLYPQQRVTPGSTRRPLGELLSGLARAHPDVALLDGYFATAADAPHTAAHGFGVSARRGVRVYWIDPYTAEVRGDTPLLSVGSIATRLHASLFVPVVGYALVSLFSLFLLTSTVTGILSYRRWWHGYLRRPRTTRARLWLGDAHRLIGVWLLPFLVVMTVTGLVYCWDFVASAYIGLPERPLRSAPLELSAERLGGLGPEVPTRRPVDELVAAVHRRHPDFVVTALLLPEHAAAPFAVLGHRGEWFVDPRLSRIDFDPYSGEIVRESLLGNTTLGHRLHHAVNPLHFGFFGGLASKLLWLAGGLALSTLAMSGVLIRVERLGGDATLARRLWWPVGGPMGWLKPFNVALLGLGGIGLAGFSALANDPLASVGARWSEQRLGPWTAAVAAIDEGAVLGRGDPCAAGASALLVVDFCTGCFDQIKAAHLEVVESGGTIPLARARIEGAGPYAHAHLSMPEGVGADSELRVVVEAWNGDVHQARWKIRDAVR